MIGWTEEQQEYRRAVRRFVEAEVAPKREALELGDLPPYGVLRSYYAAFGIGDAALDRFWHAKAHGPNGHGSGGEDRSARSSAAEVLIPMIELSRWCPGLVTALGVSVGLTAGTILRSGSAAQRERWAPPLLTLEKVGAWAITEPDSGSDAFGSMRTVARPDGDGFVLDGSKTFITNGPYADTIVVICKLDDGRPSSDREIVTFVLDCGMPGLEQSAPLRKLGLHSSPTGEVSFQDVRVGRDRLLQPSRTGAKARDGVRANFATERAGVAAMALGVIERCRELAVDYARNRVQFGRRIGDFQLVQLKLAEIEVARLNVENLVLRYIAMADAGRRPTLAEASAMKLYSARAAVEVASAAVQVFGGNGYMAENHVEQLYRDARVFQIYGGTDEIQVTHVARDLLR